MKRYYVCKVLGNGSMENPYRAAINDVVDPQTHLLAFNTSVMLASNPDGTPKYPWCLVIAAGNKHGLVAGNADVDALPDYPLDVKISAMNAATKVSALQKMSLRGIDTTALGNSDGYRDLIRSLGKMHDAAFNENSFDAAE